MNFVADSSVSGGMKVLRQTRQSTLSSSFCYWMSLCVVCALIFVSSFISSVNGFLVYLTVVCVYVRMCSYVFEIVYSHIDYDAAWSHDSVKLFYVKIFWLETAVLDDLMWSVVSLLLFFAVVVWKCATAADPLFITIDKFVDESRVWILSLPKRELLTK